MKSLSYHAQTITSSITFLFVKHVYWRFITPLVGLVFGGPGSGKGTLAKPLADFLGICPCSTGDVFRREMKRDPELAAKCKEYTSRGLLVPDEITMTVLKRELKRWRYRNGFILDGFPRTANQAQLLDELLAEWGTGVVVAVLLDPDEATLIQRLSSRLTCSNSSCGRTFNLRTKPPAESGICDACKSPLYQREDDGKPEVISERLSVYRRESKPIYVHYGALLVVIKPAADWTEQEVLSAAVQAFRGRNGAHHE